LEAFRQGLRALGRVEGEHVMIHYRWSGGKPELFPALVADFIRLGVDIIYTPGSVAAARAAKQATTTIPIVFSTPADPVEAGLVTSLARPGGNLTGLGGGGVAASKRLALLKEAVPQAGRVAMLWNPANPTHEAGLKDLQTAAPALGVKIRPVKVSGAGELGDAFLMMRRERADALLVFGDALFRANLARIVALAADGRVPAMYIWRRAVEAGGLMAYQADRSDAPRRAAAYVDRILRGAKSADLPVEQATKFDLVIIGLSPSLK
jgi:putative ABC transport system substrate-binding protein